MNAERLLQHFDRISEAPDAIPCLRRFILDLAVRGKLVEQDPNDEPAMELLKRIEKEKARLVKEGKIKKEPIFFDKESVLFSLPTSWSWARFVEVAAIESNLVKPDSFPDHPHIAPDNIEGRTGRLLDYQTIRESKVFSAKHRFFPGHIVYSKIRPNLAKAALVDFEGLCSADMYPIRPFIDRAFLHKFMLSEAFVQQSIKEDNRVAMPKINQESLSRILVVVPPLAEQHRIVARVDELMALCDQLEAAKTNREQSRDRLVAASLHHLNQPADTAEGDALDALSDHARFIFNHLPRLTTRPVHIKQLRQTILNLSVRGKLVPQDPNDEPASELLKRIGAEKGRLEKEGKIKKEKPLVAVQTDTAPFEIPEKWKWVRLGDLTEVITKGSSPKWQGVKYVSKDKGVLFVTSENVGNYRLRKMEEPKYVEQRFNEIEPRSILRFGDILMNLVGASIGRTAIYDLYVEANINQAVALVRLVHSTPSLCVDFLLHYFNSPFAIQLMLASQVVTAQPNMSLTDAREFPVPVPPLAEQHRIVAKADELMALCDQLEAQLTTTEADSRRLLEAVLHEALAPALEETG